MSRMVKASFAVFLFWGGASELLAENYHDPALRCPAGVESDCTPRLVGSIVLCGEEGELTGYNSISDFCLSCHATNRQMVFTHPSDIEYPETRSEFREPLSLDENITLEAGAVTCRTCHSGLETENHFLLSHYGSDRICGHCHVTELECPGEKSELQSVCFPGLLNGGVRCVIGKDIILLPGTSEFCADCHGGIESMSRSHPVDIQYPLNRPGFTPISELDANIELENGHITCRSCHEKIDEGMSLCVECHPR